MFRVTIEEVEQGDLDLLEYEVVLKAPGRRLSKVIPCLNQADAMEVIERRLGRVLLGKGEKKEEGEQ